MKGRKARASRDKKKAFSEGIANIFRPRQLSPFWDKIVSKKGVSGKERAGADEHWEMTP